MNKSRSHDAEIVALMEKGEPRSPNEVGDKLGINQKTAQSAMLELAFDGVLMHKRFGRYHIFWMRQMDGRPVAKAHLKLST